MHLRHARASVVLEVRPEEGAVSAHHRVRVEDELADPDHHVVLDELHQVACRRVALVEDRVHAHGHVVGHVVVSGSVEPQRVRLRCNDVGRASRSRRVGPGATGNETRSSVQGNCSAKSLAGNVADSSLSSLSSPQGGGSGRVGEGGPAGGEGSSGGMGVWQGGGGAGDISVQLPYTALPHGASP